MVLIDTIVLDKCGAIVLDKCGAIVLVELDTAVPRL
jgi:hypothetical protein